MFERTAQIAFSPSFLQPENKGTLKQRKEPTNAQEFNLLLFFEDKIVEVPQCRAKKIMTEVLLDRFMYEELQMIQRNRVSLFNYKQTKFIHVLSFRGLKFFSKLLTCAKPKQKLINVSLESQAIEITRILVEKIISSIAKRQ